MNTSLLVFALLIAGTSQAQTSTVVKTVHGLSHSCSLNSDQTVTCIGDNKFGQLGVGSLVSFSQPVYVNYLKNVIDIAAGNNHTVALLSDGTVKSWGDNSEGQLADGTTFSRAVPVSADVRSGIRISSVFAEGNQTWVKVELSNLKP